MALKLICSERFSVFTTLLFSTASLNGSLEFLIEVDVILSDVKLLQQLKSTVNLIDLPLHTSNSTTITDIAITTGRCFGCTVPPLIPLCFCRGIYYLKAHSATFLG